MSEGGESGLGPEGRRLCGDGGDSMLLEPALGPLLALGSVCGDQGRVGVAQAATSEFEIQGAWQLARFDGFVTLESDGRRPLAVRPREESPDTTRQQAAEKPQAFSAQAGS